jgi:hypothetical protein
MSEANPLEKDVLKSTLFALNTYGGVIAWRNNNGMAKRGKIMMRFGLEKGASDILALVSVELDALCKCCTVPTRHAGVVGRALAVPLFLECKRAKGSKKREEQEAFIQKVRGYGAYADWCDNPKSALEMVDRIRREVT